MLGLMLGPGAWHRFIDNSDEILLTWSFDSRVKRYEKMIKVRKQTNKE